MEPGLGRSHGVIPELTNVYNYSITGPTTGTALAPGAPISKNFHANEWEGYVQDTWHARPNITVTFGVRYTLLQTPMRPRPADCAHYRYRYLVQEA